MLGADDPLEAHRDGVPERFPVIDHAGLQWRREGREPAPGDVLVAKIVLDVPIIGIRQRLAHEHPPVLHGPVQADQVADVGVQPDVFEPDVLDQAYRRARRAEVGVLVHLQGHEHAHLGAMTT